MRKPVVLIAALAVLVIVVVVLRYSVFFDAQAWLSKLSENADERSIVAEGQQLHTGGGECLRWTTWQSFGEDDAAKVAHTLASLGLDVQSFSALAGTFDGWTDELEKPHHAQDASDERLSLLAHDEPMGGLILALNRGKLRATSDANAQAAQARATQTWSKLSKDQQRLLKQAFDQTPKAFTSTGQVRVMHALAGEVTNARLDALAFTVENLLKTGDADPAAIGANAKASLDGWQAPMHAEPVDGGVRLWSDGADRARGGQGPNADFIRVIRCGSAAAMTDGGATPAAGAAATAPTCSVSADEANAAPADDAGTAAAQ